MKHPGKMPEYRLDIPGILNFPYKSDNEKVTQRKASWWKKVLWAIVAICGMSESGNDLPTNPTVKQQAIFRAPDKNPEGLPGG